MLYINEWLPNPEGTDKGNEWIELFNGSSEKINLTGWSIRTKKGKTFVLGDEVIGPNGYLILKDGKTGLVLRNTDEQISLFDRNGMLVDKSAFTGEAPAGKSFSRTGDRFAFMPPTPGEPNPVLFAASSKETAYPLNQPLNNGLEKMDFWLLLFGNAIFITVVLTVIIKQNEYLSNLFFRGNGEVGEISGR